MSDSKSRRRRVQAFNILETVSAERPPQRLALTLSPPAIPFVLLGTPAQVSMHSPLLSAVDGHANK